MSLRTTAAFFALLLSSLPARAQNALISDFTYGGNGCPAGSATAVISSDRQALTVVFDKFQVRAGPGVSLTENRSFCQVLVDLRYDPGWQVALRDVTYGGFADLKRGVNGRLDISYYFSGSPLTSSPISWSMTGPFSESFSGTDSVGTLVWSECGTMRPISIKTNLYVSNPNAPTDESSSMSDISELRLQALTRYGLQFRRCL